MEPPTQASKTKHLPSSGYNRISGYLEAIILKLLSVVKAPEVR